MYRNVQTFWLYREQSIIVVYLRFWEMKWLDVLQQAGKKTVSAALL